MSESQPELFTPEPGPAVPLPEDLRKELEFITGAVPGETGTFGASFTPHPAGKSAQELFLEQRAKKTEKVAYEMIDPRLLVLDLATQKGREDYEAYLMEIPSQVAADPDSWRVSETPFPPMIDPGAESGFRLITVIRYWRQKKTKVQGEHGFTVV